MLEKLCHQFISMKLLKPVAFARHSTEIYGVFSANKTAFEVKVDVGFEIK